MSAKLVELIEVDESRGEGSEASPYRTAKAWYTKAGDFVVEKDGWKEDQARNPEPKPAIRSVTILVESNGTLSIKTHDGEWVPGWAYKLEMPLP